MGGGGGNWDCYVWVNIRGSLLVMGSLGKRRQVCRQLGQKHDGQGAPMGAEWATSHS